MKSNLGSGTGSLLLQELINRINESGTENKIFVLTYNPEFFKKNKFKVVEKDTLPEKIWKDCDNCEDKENCGEIAMVYYKD